LTDLPKHTPKNVLYLSYDGLTDPLGQSQILPYLLGLAQNGHFFTIISAEKKENYDLRKDVILEKIQNTNISWQPIFYTKKPPVFSTLWDLWKIRKKAIRLHQKKSFEIIHCRSYLTALIGLFFKKKYKLESDIKFVFDMRGFWADERIDGNLWNLKNPIFNLIYKFFKRKEQEFIQNADAIISLTENAKQEIMSWETLKNTNNNIQKNNIKVHVIPCCADLEVFKQSANYLSESGVQKISKKFCISYLGSLGTWYLLEDMLLFFKELLMEKPDAEFLFITPDAPNFILDAAEKLQIPVHHFRIQKAERLEVPEMLLESDISLFFIKDAYSKKASSPTKMGEILAMGIPIIANDIGDHSHIFEKYHCGILIKQLDTQGFREAIKQIPEFLNQDKAYFRAVAQDYFSLTKGVELYQKVYETL
jgi:glycosyltransferase involved in cell wall biosynthesis